MAIRSSLVGSSRELVGVCVGCFLPYLETEIQPSSESLIAAVCFCVVTVRCINLVKVVGAAGFYEVHAWLE